MFMSAEASNLKQIIKVKKESKVFYSIERLNSDAKFRY